MVVTNENDAIQEERAFNAQYRRLAKMTYWVDAFEFSVDMYSMWMNKRKNRRKARYYRKLKRLKNRRIAYYRKYRS